jgi:DNA-directed RNA polymerase specialized sigma24 family protein
VPASSSGPLSDLLTRERADLVRQVIQELGASRDRDILLRFYIAEEDKERISRDFGLSSLQFNRVLHRARQRYREVYLERVKRAGLERSGAGQTTFLLSLAIILLLAPLSWLGRTVD